jgi:predicted AlkP superfamily pyrophosphatase or phosphodiesterase
MRRPFRAPLLAALVGLGFAVAAPVAGSAAGPPAAAAGEGKPRLLLFLVVDQGRADSLERFRPVFRYGLKRLLDSSTRFTQAFHEHGVPRTAPGHATLVTGAYPSHHGVIANSWIDPKSGSKVNAHDGATHEVAPTMLRRGTLGDAIKRVSPSSKVYGVSQKHRSANILAGLKGDGAFWIVDETGRFRGSSYFPESDPSRFGLPPERLSADRFFGRLWEPIDLDAMLATPGWRPVSRGSFPRAFPHSLGEATLAPDKDFYVAFSDSPWVDEMTAEMAIAILDSRELGRDDAVDLLGVSFSAVDGVGHYFGNESPEMLDTLLRLDRVVGLLLDAVDRSVGLDRTVISLSADHGASPIPGELAVRGIDARKLYGEDVACEQRAAQALSDRWGADRWVRPGPFLEEEALARHGVSRADAEDLLEERIERCPGVVEVWTSHELTRSSPPADETERLFRNAYFAGRSPDVLVQLKPHWLGWTGESTTHTSVYEYDRHVPWVVRLPHGTERVVEQAVATADVAPTLAELFGLPPLPDADGVSRLAWLTDRP